MPDFQPVLIFFHPLLQFPWLFVFISCLSVSIGAALCALVVYRKQLIWQRETAERLEDSIQSRTLELQVALTELGEKNRALEEQNTLDALSGVRNRAYFDKKIQAEMKRSRREQRPLALVMLDIDHFKQINDQHGHLAGDAVIRGVAQRIQSLLKRSSDHVCRYGGEEFALLLPNTDAEGVVALAEQIRQSIADTPFDTEIGALSVRISAGCYAAITESAMVSSNYIQAADEALYRAKHAGRNQVQLTPAVTAETAAGQPETEPTEGTADESEL